MAEKIRMSQAEDIMTAADRRCLRERKDYNKVKLRQGRVTADPALPRTGKTPVSKINLQAYFVNFLLTVSNPTKPDPSNKMAGGTGTGAELIMSLPHSMVKWIVSPLYSMSSFKTIM